MANASCANCTLVSNLLTLVGSVSGTVLVGMTVTGPSVPPGTTITSFGTGSGAAGTYNCSASSANIPTSEAMVFSLSWDMPLIGNAGFPQLADLGRAAGFGLVVAAAITGPTAGPGQQYTYGAHAAALYNAQAQSGSRIFNAVEGKQGPSIAPTILTQPQFPEHRPGSIIPAVNKTSEVGIRPLQSLYAAPQAYDFTVQATLTAPLSFVDNAIIAEYQFGTHSKAIIDSQGGSVVWGAVRTPPGSTGVAPIRTIIAPPQAFDFTLQGFVKTIPLAQGWLLTMVTAGPQSADFTLQASFTAARPFQSLAPAAPLNPSFFSASPQQDPTQPPARLIKPPAQSAAPQRQPFVWAAPDRADYTQVQGQILYTSLPGPSRRLQPAFLTAVEQQYDKNTYPLVFTQPTIYVPPPPFTGFYVQAVTAGFYGGRFRTPGDIFLLAQAADFSDSTVDYQVNSNGIGFGWMQRVTTQQVFDWLQSNGSPYLPPQDPFRRTVY